jgi:hypothetical protein
MEWKAMETKTAETNAPVPVPASEGNQTGNPVVLIDDQINVVPKCPHRYQGCISQSLGGNCTHWPAPCDPLDEDGRRFKVSYFVENGQTFTVKTYEPQPRQLMPIVDAEKCNRALALVASIRRNPSIGAMVRSEH